MNLYIQNKNIQVIIVLFLSTIFLIGIKFTTQINCWWLFGYIFIVAMVIFSQLLYFKTQMEKFVCSNYFKEGSFLKKICINKKIYIIFAFFLSVMLSFSMLTFIFLGDRDIIILIFADVFILYILYMVFNKSMQSQLEGNAHRVFAEILVNGFNIAIVISIVLVLSFINVHNVNFSPKIFYLVHDEIYHSCKWFKWYLRTKVLIGYSIESLRSIDQLGKIIYSFLVITSISFFPITALTLYFKFFIRKILFRSEK